MEATGSPHGGTPDIDAPHHLELSVERSAPRSDSPIAKAAQDMPLPVSPSDRSPQPRNQNASLGSSQSLDAGSPSFGENSSARGGLNVGLGVGPVGLGVPTSKAERRRSIYPAMTFNMDAHNSIFAAEPRLSPLPPSPLRASFTGVRVEQPVRSPTSPTPSHLGAESFPFRTSAAGPSVSSESAARTSSDDHRPPRTSSLPDQLSASRSRPLIAEEDETADSMDAPPQLPPKLTPVQNIDVENSTPRLLAPDLPPMTFSLSDPDFALILNHIDRSPPKESPIPRTGDPGHTIKPDADGSGSVGSRSSSPHHASSAALARSPQMDMLSSAVETEGSSRSLSRTRLSPNDQTPTPQLLRTRQPSTESTTSVASKLGRDSAFAAIVEMVATNKHIGHDTIPVDLNLLSGIVAEVEDLKDFIAGLTNKYTGAKVRRPT